MQTPDLQALQRDDTAEWDLAFHWLWPVALRAAQIVLQPYLPGDVEDVAMESFEELVDEVKRLCTAEEMKPLWARIARTVRIAWRAHAKVEELKPLLAKIAHNRAVSRLRQVYALKRGAGQKESLEGRQEDWGDIPEAIAPDDPVGALEHKEMAARLGRLLAELKPPRGEMLADFFLRGLTYEEIAKKHAVALGTVGVYLKQGLAAMRRIWGRGGKDV
jgi:RNA polymerase sigma factor (sigma-70 family)